MSVKYEDRSEMIKARVAVAAAGLITFAITAYFVSTGEPLAFDTVIREWFYSLRCDSLTAVFKIITYMGNTSTIVALCLALLILPKTRLRYGVPVSATALTVTVINAVIKNIFERPRPDVSLHLIEQGGFSFTSGHSITSFAVYGLLILLIRKYARDRRLANILTIALLIPMLLIGISRIYIGVHYPTDVLGGWSLGAVVLMAAMTAVSRR